MSDLAGSDRRQAILEAARRLFAEQGFHATATRDIARAAGVAEGTIFRYFPSKAALLMELAEPAVLAGLDRTASAFSEADLHNPAEVRRVLHGFLTDRWQRMQENRDLLTIALAETQAIPELFQRVAGRIAGPEGPGSRIFAPLARSGALRPLPMHTMVPLLIGPLLMLFQFQRAGVRLPGAVSDAEMLDQITDALLYGLMSGAPGEEKRP